MIYDNHGRISIEGRRGSFYVYADYGLKPRECRLTEVAPGDLFRDRPEGSVYQVTAQLVGRTSVRVLDTAVDIGSGDRPNDCVVIPVDDSPAHAPLGHTFDEHPLGLVWRDHPAPEFEIADLDDLIAALEDYRRRLPTDGKQSETSSLSEQLHEMADNLEAELGPSEDDREALREAARLLEVEDSGREKKP